MKYRPDLQNIEDATDGADGRREPLEAQQRDSDTIFLQITTGGFNSMEEAQTAITFFYLPDPSFSRAGICHALKRLEQYYASK
jgi:hypothetical protein